MWRIQNFLVYMKGTEIWIPHTSLQPTPVLPSGVSPPQNPIFLNHQPLSCLPALAQDFLFWNVLFPPYFSWHIFPSFKMQLRCATLKKLFHLPEETATGSGLTCSTSNKAQHLLCLHFCEFFKGADSAFFGSEPLVTNVVPDMWQMFAGWTDENKRQLVQKEPGNGCQAAGLLPKLV